MSSINIDSGAVKILLGIAACVIFPPILAFFIGWYAIIFCLWVIRFFVTMFFTALYTDPSVGCTSSSSFSTNFYDPDKK